MADGSACKIQIWDTAGQERFRAMAPMYYRNAAAAIVCYDMCDENSFATMKDWVEELKQNCQDRGLILAIACNKADLPNRVVSRARAEQFAESISAIYMDTSAKENFGVNELFQRVAERVIETQGEQLKASTGPRQGGPARGASAGGAGGLSQAAQYAGFQDSPLNYPYSNNRQQARGASSCC